MTHRSTRPPTKGKRPTAAKPIRFESVNDLCTATNEEHVKLLLNELPWMRAGVWILNMNDRDLEAKIRTGGKDTAESLLELAETLTKIQKRYTAAVKICSGSAARVLIVLERLHAAGELAQ